MSLWGLKSNGYPFDTLRVPEKVLYNTAFKKNCDSTLSQHLKPYGVLSETTSQLHLTQQLITDLNQITATTGQIP